MGRKITEALLAAEPEGTPTGVTFVKNQTNELIRFPDGTFHKFTTSRQTVENADLIEKLRIAAALPGNPYGIFEAE